MTVKIVDSKSNTSGAHMMIMQTLKTSILAQMDGMSSSDAEEKKLDVLSNLGATTQCLADPTKKVIALMHVAVVLEEDDNFKAICSLVGGGCGAALIGFLLANNAPTGIVTALGKGIVLHEEANDLARLSSLLEESMANAEAIKATQDGGVH